MREQYIKAKRANASAEERIIGSLRYCSGFLRHHTEGKGSQRRVLLMLRRRGPMTQRDILEEMGVRASSMSELLGKLEAKGYVTKEKSEADKRNYSVSITADGERALEEMQAQYELSVADLLSGLEAGEKAQLAALLDKLQDLWRERADAPPHGHGHPWGRGQDHA